MYKDQLLKDTQISAADTRPRASDDAWMQLLRRNTTEKAPARRSRLQRVAMGVLLGFIGVMALFVRVEVRSAPEGAIAGLWLRTQIKIAELIPSSNRIVTEAEQRPLSMTSGPHASKARKGRRHSSRVSSASRPIEEATTEGAAARVQVLPIRPLRPFIVEVVSGPQRRLLAARPSSVHVDISDEQSLLENNGSPAGSQAGTSPATLRALISPEGRVEDLWLVRGPRPTPATLDLLRQAHYRPLLVNGIPMETEAFIIMDVPPQELQPESATSHIMLR